MPLVLLSPADVPSQTDVQKTKTDASQQKQKSPSAEALRATTAAPLPITPTPQPRATGVVGRGGPIALPTPKNDNVIVSECDLLDIMLHIKTELMCDYI